MRDKRWSNFVLAGLFGISLFLLFRILTPFLIPVLLGGFLVVLFQPLHRWLERRCGARPALCASLATMSVFLLLVAPLLIVGWLVGRELMALAIQTQVTLEHTDLRQEFLAMLPGGVRRYVRAGFESAHLEQALMGALFGSASIVKQLVRMSTELAIDLFLMLVAIYYFFLDGRRLLATTLPMLPLEAKYVHAFTREFTDVAYAIVYGNTVTALIQGLLGGIGLLLAGVPHAPVWAAAMAVVALVPVGGTALVWGPIGLILMATGSIAEGLFVWTWGTFIVSSIDNLIRPRLCGSRMTLHPLLVFLSMFGGLAVFGLAGLLIGPLVASLFMAMVRIYRRDFLKLPSPEAAAESSPATVPVGVEGVNA